MVGNLYEIEMITAEHIRYAQNAQLEELTGYQASSFSEWTNSETRQMSGNTQERIAQKLGMDKLEFIKGWDSRREDASVARKYQEQLTQIIDSQLVGMS